MADRPWSELIRDHPLGTSLRRVNNCFHEICQIRGISPTPDGLDQLDSGDRRVLINTLLSILAAHPFVDRLPSKADHGSLKVDIEKLIEVAISHQHLEFERIRPLLDAVLTDKPDSEIWDQVYNAVTEFTFHSQQITLPLPQPQLIRSTRWFRNSSEHLKYMDDVLKEEVGFVYVGLRDFHAAFFGGVPGLQKASEAFFEQCVKSSNPFFDNGWRGWPKDVNRDSVLSWFSNFCEKLVAFAENHEPFSTRHRRLMAKLNGPFDNRMAQREMDIGFVNYPSRSHCHWSNVLVPGEVKSDLDDDRAWRAWLDLGRDARRVFFAQVARRFVLGFTICGSLMRIWEFDRLGAIASDQFDINVDGLRFVSTVLGFLWMDEEQLGFDTTIITSGRDRYIEIERNGSTERLIIDEQMMQPSHIAGRATTCWKAHREGDANTPLVIKDSWQYTGCDEEGELLQEATDKGVVNVARYYYHETLRASGKEDDIRDNIRKRIDVTKAVDFQSKLSGMTANIRLEILPNRVHRRVILCDYGKEICMASSAVALLTALEGCIEGHESLYRAGFLHRDISVQKLMINEDRSNPSLPSFLIDLDSAIRREPREGVSGAKEKVGGTRAFMAIGVLRGEQHSFMHDLESFFWVLFWICIHFQCPGRDDETPESATQFEKWKYMDMDDLAKLKLDTIAQEDWFLLTMNKCFTPYYSALMPCVHKLWQVVFPDGRPWKTEDEDLYFSMKKILRDAREDLKVLLNA